MQILIICKDFFPEISPRSSRATELAIEFARQGKMVTVLTNDKNYDYSMFKNEHTIEVKFFGRLRFRPLTSSRWPLVGDWKRKLGRMMFLLLNYPDIEIMWRLQKALRHEKGYDLMISIAVPYSIHWGTVWARSQTHRIAGTWVADCGDPFMGNRLESFRHPFYFAYLEKWFCKKADYITIPVEHAISGYYPEFHLKIRIIPQGFNFENIPERRFRNSNPILNFAYAGGIALKGVRSPIKIIEYLLSKNNDFIFHIYSASELDFLLPYITKSEGRIVLHKPLLRDALLSELNQMDFLVNFDNGTTMQRPSKLIDYALTGRPILNIDPADPDILLIDEFINKNYSRSFSVKNIDRYDIRNVANQFISLAKISSTFERE